MKKIMRKKIVILCFLLSCLSCEKEHTYSGLYRSSIIDISQIRLFSKNGEITDKNKIHDYVSRRKIDFLIENIDTALNVTDKVQIEFVSDDRVIFTYNDYSDNRILKNVNDYLYFESEAISTRYNIGSDLFYDKVITHTPLFADTIPISSSSGFSTKTDYKHCYYTKKRTTFIEFPILSFHYMSVLSDVYFSSESYGWFNNEFNANSLNYLTANDTLVIQEMNIMLEKQ